MDNSHALGKLRSDISEIVAGVISSVLPDTAVMEKIAEILKKKIVKKDKQKQIKELVFSNKKKLDKSEESIIKAITGADIKLSDLCNNNMYDDIENNTISLADSDFDENEEKKEENE